MATTRARSTSRNGSTTRAATRSAPTSRAGNGRRSPDPLLGQRGPEIQRFATLRTLPIDL